MSLTDRDRYIMGKLADVIKETHNHTIADFLDEGDLLGVIIHAEVGAACQRIMYHIAESRKVPKEDLWDIFDI